MNQNLPTSSTSVLTVNDQIINADKQIKIREISDPYVALNAFIAKVLILLDVKHENKPTIEYQKVMIDGINRYHGSHSIDELYLAIELNLNGKLKDKIDHYGKFTIDYLSSCLHLFNEEKKAAILRAKTVATPAPRPVELPTEQKRIHDLHRDKSYWDVMVNFVKEQGYIPAFWDWSKVYHYLKETGQFTDYSKERLDKIYEEISGKTKGNASRERMLSDTIGKMNFATASSSDERIKDLCRKRVVEEILTNQYSEYICRANPIQ